MKRLLAVAAVAAAVGCIGGSLRAEDIPLPRPRPKIEAGVTIGPPPLFVAADPMDEMTQCQSAIQEFAVIESIALLNAADGCGNDDLVRLKAVLLPDRRRVALNPPAELRCKMALALASWLREDVVPTFADRPLASIFNYNSYECRPRNRLFGARISEHGRGNALDVRAFIMADGSAVDPTDIHVARPLREKIRKDACTRFVTVLGPGSDGFHEKHVHLDMAERRGNYRICHWAVREPPPPPPVASQPPAPQAPAVTQVSNPVLHQVAEAVVETDDEEDAGTPAAKPLSGKIPLPRPRPRRFTIFDRLRL